jgi:hypothetical protein
MFQFKNKETGYIYTLHEVDEIAAKFWGKEVHQVQYATPNGPNPGNWFDILGACIEDLQYFVSKDSQGKRIYLRSIDGGSASSFDFSEVAAMILGKWTRYNTTAERVFEDMESLKPYIELCFHLKSMNIIGIGLGW